MTLSWHATEFGRRTDDGRYRIVHRDGGWQLLDAQWTPLAAPTRKIPESQALAEHVERRVQQERKR
jgi:hypothetical protein